MSHLTRRSRREFSRSLPLGVPNADAFGFGSLRLHRRSHHVRRCLSASLRLPLCSRWVGGQKLACRKTSRVWVREAGMQGLCKPRGLRRTRPYRFVLGTSWVPFGRLPGWADSDVGWAGAGPLRAPSASALLSLRSVGLSVGASHRAPFGERSRTAAHALRAPGAERGQTLTDLAMFI